MPAGAPEADATEPYHPNHSACRGCRSTQEGGSHTQARADSRPSARPSQAKTQHRLAAIKTHRPRRPSKVLMSPFSLNAHRRTAPKSSATPVRPSNRRPAHPTSSQNPSGLLLLQQLRRLRTRDRRHSTLFFPQSNLSAGTEELPRSCHAVCTRLAAPTLRHDLGGGLARAAPLRDHGAAGLLLLLLALGVQAAKRQAARRRGGGVSGFV